MANLKLNPSLPWYPANHSFVALFKQLLLCLLILLVGSPSAKAQSGWLHEQRTGDTAYFLFDNRIEQFDLQTGNFLTPITLPRNGATSFKIEDDRTWIAYGTEIYRYEPDLTGEALFKDVETGEVTDFNPESGYMIVVHPGPDRSRISTYSLANGDRIDLEEYGNEDYEKVTFDSRRQTVFTRGSSSDNQGIPISPQGAIANSFSSVDSPDFIDKTWLWPDGSLLVDGHGSIFNPLDLRLLGSFPTRVASLDFYEDRLPVIFRNNRLIGLDIGFRETGSISIAQDIETLYVSGDNVRLFYPSSGARGMAVRNVSLQSIGISGTPPSTPDPRTLEFEPDEAFVDKNENALLYSRLYRTVFRWSVDECRYLESIHLGAAPPEFSTYDPITDTIFFINRHSEVSSLALSPAAQLNPRGYALPVREFGTVGYLSGRGPQSITALDDKLLIARRSGGSFYQFDLIDHNANLITEGSSSFSGTFRMYWEPLSRRVFGLSFRGGTNRELLRTDLNADNRFGRVWEFDIPGGGADYRLAFNDDASLIVTTGGNVVTPDWGEEADFGRSFVDVSWRSNRIRSIEEGEDQTTIFRNRAYPGSENPPVTIAGEPQRLFLLPENRALIVSRVDGVPLFSILNDEDVLVHDSAEAPPSITTEPRPTRVDFGGEVVLQVQAVGSGPFSYQWYKDGSILAGETDLTLTIGNSGSNDRGLYHVVVSNQIGQVASEPVPLGVGPVPEGGLTNGSLIITTDSQVREFNIDGTLIQSFSIPVGPEFPSNRIRRYYDAAVDRFGRLHVLSQIEIPNFPDFNGPAFLSTWDPEFDHWSHLEIVSPRVRDRIESLTQARLLISDDWIITAFGRLHLVNPRDIEIPNPDFLDDYLRLQVGLDGSLFLTNSNSAVERLAPEDWSVVDNNVFRNIEGNPRITAVTTSKEGTIYFTTSEGTSQAPFQRIGKFENETFTFAEIPGDYFFTSDLHLSGTETLVASGSGDRAVLVDLNFTNFESFTFAPDGDRSASAWADYQGFPDANAEFEIPATTNEDEAFALILAFSHPDPDASLRIANSFFPPWLSITEGGILSGTPLASDVGSSMVAFLVTDQSGRSTTFQFPIEVLEVDDAVIIQPFSITMPEDGDAEQVDLSNFVSDEESPFEELALRATLPSPPTEMLVSVDLTNGVLSVTPLPDLNGNIELTLTASDGGSDREVIARIPILVTPVNDSPIVVAEIEDLTATADASPITVETNAAFFDVDKDDKLSFSLSSNTNPNIFSSAAIDSESGRISLIFAPYVSGNSTLTIRATDLDGLFAEQEMEITLPDIPPPTLSLTSGGSGTLDSEIVINRQTGLFEQKLTLTNSAARAIGGFKITVNGLDAGTSLHSGESNEIVYASPVASGESVTLTLEYLSRTTRDSISPNLTLELLTPEKDTEANADSTNAPDRILVLPDRSILLDFQTGIGETYEIQYTTDLENWIASPSRITASSNRTQWLDQGLPRTNCHPADCASRLYRIRKISEVR